MPAKNKIDCFRINFYKLLSLSCFKKSSSFFFKIFLLDKINRIFKFVCFKYVLGNTQSNFYIGLPKMQKKF